MIFTPSKLTLGLCLLCSLIIPAAHAEQQPIDVLRKHINAGIAVLTNDTQKVSSDALEIQQQQLCALTHDMFDMYAFSRLVVAAHWQQFSAAEQTDFVNVFGDFLCRYYIGGLQKRYSNETVEFHGQEFKSATRAVVNASVFWQELEIPVEVRMVRRGRRWKAYDLVVSGISGVMIYRSQLDAELSQNTPAEVIAELRRRTAEQT